VEPGSRTGCAATRTATSGAAGGGGEGLDGVAIFDSAAKLIGRILLPERCANLCFGGVKRNRLFMAASQSLYALYVNGQGVKGG
jgi:gluconolactonase